MAITIDDLKAKLATQAERIAALETRIPLPTPAPDLQPIADGIDANTAKIDAILAAPNP